MSTSIDKTIKGIISGLRKAAQGDLKVEFHTNRKDEFKTLTEEIQHNSGELAEAIQKFTV